MERLLAIAAYALPSIDQEENEEFLTAIFALYGEVVGDDEKTTALRQGVLAQKGVVKQCLQQFKLFVDKEIMD